jgi:hypothetical protein
MIALMLAAALNCGAFHIDLKASQPLAPVAETHAPGSCHVRQSHGYAIPDPTCTPGAINPTVTAITLRDKNFRTGCIRDGATSADQKRQVYSWYGITPPTHNAGPTQTCELDHLVSLRIAGADTLDNVWPECDHPEQPIGKRGFKIKDAKAENDAAKAVKAGADLSDIQRRVAQDWTQFLTGP